jgi:hypothetical protein
MTKHKTPAWTDDDLRRLIEKRSILPLEPSIAAPTRWYWTYVFTASAIGIVLAFLYGAYVE